ncbi:MAG: hypothetical protein IPP69_16900 [Flavobacteriales bacterium]|nr:hypothetical protein [Flavobacteriales bacterium]
MKNTTPFSIAYFVVFILFVCCQSKTTEASAAKTTTEVSTISTVDFLKPVGIYASISDNLVQVAEPGTLHLYTPDGKFEYLITWAGADQTPEKMKAALSVGTATQQGMIHKTNGAVVKLGEKVELTPFGVYDISMNNSLFEGLEIHDWSSSRGILVITIMCRKEVAPQLENRIKSLYQSVRIPDLTELENIKAKIKADRQAGIKSKIEEKYWNKVVGQTLLNSQIVNGQPFNKVEQRFELCDTGTAKFTTENAGVVTSMDGKWDIVETEDGVTLLVITDMQGLENKWQIGPHISGNVTLGNVEFKLHPMGSAEGPRDCQ